MSDRKRCPKVIPGGDRSAGGDSDGGGDLCFNLRLILQQHGSQLGKDLTTTNLLIWIKIVVTTACKAARHYAQEFVTSGQLVESPYLF